MAHFKLKLSATKRRTKSPLIPRDERKLREQQKKISLLVNSMRLARRARSKQDRLTRPHLEYLLLRLVLPPLTPRSNRTSNLQRAAKETLATLSKNLRPAHANKDETNSVAGQWKCIKVQRVTCKLNANSFQQVPERLRFKGNLSVNDVTFDLFGRN